MKAIVDDKIPYIREAILQLVDQVEFLPGTAIGREEVRDADILIVRTRTRCDRTLLEGSKVRFIATATIGFDHLDVDYLYRAGIQWTNCPGCNASSVGQYIQSCLWLLAREKGMDLSRITVGIVGVGHVGGNVYQRLSAMGIKCLLCDPPRALNPDNTLPFHSLEELKQQCNVITFHTPLQYEGPFATWHMADQAFFDSLTTHPVLINTSRGEVVDNEALEQALCRGQVSDAILDTWEHEPHISASLLQRVFIGTPHIAGYSADGKANATRMTLEALSRWMGKPRSFTISPPALPASLVFSQDPIERDLQLYNPHTDSQRLKADITRFEDLRNHYPLRREGIEYRV